MKKTRIKKIRFGISLGIIVFFLIIPPTSAQVTPRTGVQPTGVQSGVGGPVQTGQSIQNAFADAIGVAAAVHGQVFAQDSGGSRRSLKSGMPVFLGDRIIAEEASQVQIMLKDETVFTLGSKSELVLDEFIYDSSSDTGKVSAEVIKGVFRFVTGRIARKKPDNMNVKLPSGNIGIRGTIVGGQVIDLSSLIVLLGPGEKNNTGNKMGKISVGNEVKGEMKSVTVNKTGFGTKIEGPGVPPTIPAIVPKDVILGISNSLSPPAQAQKTKDAASQADAQGAGEQAKQNTFVALSDVSNSEGITDLAKAFDDQKNTQAAEIVNKTIIISDGLAKLEDLRTVETGRYYFSGSGNLDAGAALGNYTVALNIDFGARTVGGGNSNFTGVNGSINSATPFPMSLLSQSFASGTGDAVFKQVGSVACGGSPCDVDVTMKLNNAGGVVAANSDHAAKVVHLASTYTGSGTACRHEGQV